jgi:Dockerin type I domain
MRRTSLLLNIVLSAVFILISNSSLSGQISIGGEPPSFSRSLKADMHSVKMGDIDVVSLLAEDENEKEMGMPYRFGYGFDVNYTLENSGTWEYLPDGSRIWRLLIECPGAYSINLIYEQFWLPEGSSFFIYSENREMILGAFTSQNNKEYMQFSTGLVRGEVSILEYHEPADVELPGIINISRVIHGYKNLFSYKEAEGALGFGNSGSCNNNVNCPEGDPWQDEIRSAAMIVTSGGQRICSGALINNVRQDLTPYFLTANHCLGTPTTWIIIFNYESPDCTNIDGPLWMTVSGSTLHANSAYSDFALLELSTAPPDSYNVFYSGWSAVDSAASSAVGIHHPRGDIKKISFEYDSLEETSYLQPPGTGTNYWRVELWDDGTTEPSSSGSPLYDQNHRIIGQLHGGYASCTNLEPDWYGKFARSWDYGSTPATRLNDWLDPDNTGAMILDGINAIGVTIAHTPLENTKDTLNDYEVLCEISSTDALVADSLLLNYEINSVSYVDTLELISGAEYHGFIPTQSPGTEIEYYLYARNIEDYIDSTEIFTFRVIDYDIILEPAVDSSYAAVGDTIWYNMTVTNNGIYTDEASLSVIDNNWPTTIWDLAATSQITSTGLIAPDISYDFLVRVIVGISNYQDVDSTIVSAVSAGDPSVSANSALLSISAGETSGIPFIEYFPNTTLDPVKWIFIAGADITDEGLNEPTGPYSLHLDGSPDGSDTLISQAINLKDEIEIILKYSYQQTGSGEPPDPGDDLFIMYFNSTGEWILLNQYLGADPDMTDYVNVEMILPSDALHSGFRIRIHNSATTGAYDDWYVDDIYVGYPSNYDLSVQPVFQTQYTPSGDSAIYFLTIHNDGTTADSYDLVDSNSVWDISIFDESGSTPISSTPEVAPEDSVEVMVKVAVPGGTPLHQSDTGFVYVFSQGDPLLAAYAELATFSAGLPQGIPWYETFPDDTLYTDRWFYTTGVEVSLDGIDEPSNPYSLNFDGEQDTAVTQSIDLSGRAGIVLSYYYQAGGEGIAPPSGSDLYVEYRNSSDAWVNFNSYLGSDSSMSDFVYVNPELPPDALHSNFQIRFRTSGPVGDWFIDDIRVDFAPTIAVSPLTLNEILLKGDTSEAEIVISNNGMGELLYDIIVDYDVDFSSTFADLFSAGKVEPASRDYPAWIFGVQPVKGEEIEFEGYRALYNAGGPDDFGYFWIDSDQPNGPSFDWIDISSTGTDIITQLDDDSYYGPLEIGFDFEFYGINYSQIYAGSNGNVGFNTTGLATRYNTPLPDTTSPNAILALMWDDLSPQDIDNPDAHVYFEAFPDKYVIQYENYPEYHADSGDVITAQIILFKDGLIKYQYKYVAPGFEISSNTIGIENEDASAGLEIAYLSPMLHDSLAIQIYNPIEWFIPASYEGVIQPGEADSLTCLFVTSEQLDSGFYTADLIILNNDPINDSMVIEVQLDVYNSPWYICGDANSDSDLNVSDAVYIINYVFISGSPAPVPLDAGEVNCDGSVNVSDAVYIINYVFISGSLAPCENCPYTFNK